MKWEASLDLLAWAGHLAVFALVLVRPQRNPLVWPVGLLAFNMFAWNFAHFAFVVSGRVQWHWVDLGLSPLSPAIALHLGARFVGQTPLRRATVVLFYGWAAGLAAVAWLAFVMQPARGWIGSQRWSVAFLTMDLAVLVVALTWLGRHARRVPSQTERARTLTMIAAMAGGALLCTPDFLNDLRLNLPPLANVGSLFSSSLLAMASLRLRIFGRNVSPRSALLGVSLALGGVLGYAALIRWLSGSTAGVMIGTATLTLLLVAAVRSLGREYLERRERIRTLAHQGRLSAQMAHDLKNPLAALKGAVQYLSEEARRGGSLESQRQFFDLLLDQVDRIDHTVDRYTQLGRLHPRLAETDLNQVVRKVLALQGFVRDDVVVRSELGDDLPRCYVDPDLVGRAVENLVRNSSEAMPGGGVISVRTAVHRRRGRAAGAMIAVADTGPGMDERQSAQAFDDFFTTKPQGSGMGLAFIRRVVQAHGGRVELASELGRGTSVSLFFPTKRDGHHETEWMRSGGG